MKMSITSIAAVLLGLANAGMAAAPAPGAVNVLNPNTAKVEEMSPLPQMNAQIAQTVVAGRPYANTAALNALLTKSLNDTQRAEVNTRLFVPINLNTATREEILLIPGMSNRMVREFLEYRPYSSIEQFRREIGKYVDAKEVARLESYVTLRQ